MNGIIFLSKDKYFQNDLQIKIFTCEEDTYLKEKDAEIKERQRHINISQREIETDN